MNKIKEKYILKIIFLFFYNYYKLLYQNCLSRLIFHNFMRKEQFKTFKLIFWKTLFSELYYCSKNKR